jgi:surface antigen
MDQKNIEDNDSIVELPQEVNEIDSTQSVPEEIEQIDDFPELETANEPSSVSNFANRGINKLDEKLSNSKNNKNPVNKIKNANNKNSNNKMPGLNKNNLKNNLGKNKFGNNKLASALNKRRGLNKIPKLNSNRSQSLGSNSVPGENSDTSPGKSNRFKNLFGGRKNKNVNKPSFQKLIIKFIKKNPGLFLSIAVGFFSFLMHFLLILVLIFAVMYVIELLSNVTEVINNVGQIIWNGIIYQKWETDQSMYLHNIEVYVDLYLKDENKYDKSTVDAEKIRYYVNTTTFYSNVVDPDLIGIESSGENSTESDNDDIGTFIGDSATLDNKYSSVKLDPKELIPKMFDCAKYENGIRKESVVCPVVFTTHNIPTFSGNLLSGSKFYFSEEKYEKYLREEYVPKKFINCDKCSYKDASNDEKTSIADRITNEIMSQAKSNYVSHNADDKSNYTAYSIQSSGITVKDKEGNIIGKYSLSEYVETIVERDAAKYNDEVKKAYALTVISKLLVNVSNNEIVEDNFDSSIVTDSTKKAVASVIDLKIMKDGKVYYSTFDFEKAQKVNPQEYVAILKALFGDDISIEKSISDGLQLDSTTGFYMRVSSPSPDSNTKSYQDYYGSNNTSLIGECAWYATNRAREITNALGVRTWTTNRNGGTFCEDNGDAIYYERCWPSRGEKCAPKQGAIVSWSHGTYGHVGIIEKVNADNTVLLSHSWVRNGKYGYKYGTTEAMEDDIDAGKIDRLDNCIGKGADGCSVFETISITRLEHIWNGYNIVCYIYLTDPK